MNTTRSLDASYKNLYDSQASDYDRHRFAGRRGGYAKRFKNELILDILNRRGLLTSTSRILDVPSGTGRVTHALLTTSLGHICAADISAEMLKINEGKLSRQDRSRVRIVEANMKQLPVERDSFDAAIMSSFFYLVPCRTYQEYISDVYRVLRPGGILIAEVSNALVAYNPKNLAHVLTHKHIRRQPVKSYVYWWQLKKLFSPFTLEEFWGAEFPLIGKSYDGYRSLSNALGSSKPWKLFSGKFTVVLRKRRNQTC